MILFTPAEAADKLKVKPVTVIRLFDDGALPGVVIRQGARKRIIRFSEDSLQKFVTNREKRVSK